MEKLYIALGILAAVVIAVMYILPERKEEKPYIKRKIQSESEKKLFELLLQITPNAYVVFPQIHLASILEVRNGIKEWWAYFNKIIRKSVDFVIADKVTMMPVLAIELDDRSHERPKRKERDEFVNDILKDSELQIVHIKTSELNDPNGIKARVLTALGSSENNKVPPQH